MLVIMTGLVTGQSHERGAGDLDRAGEVIPTGLVTGQ